MTMQVCVQILLLATLERVGTIAAPLLVSLALYMNHNDALMRCRTLGNKGLAGCVTPRSTQRVDIIPHKDGNLGFTLC